MGKTLAQLWSQTAAREPAAVAVVDAASGRTWTRADLAAAIAARRAALPAADALVGRCVVLAARNSAEWLACWLALIEAGAIPAALDPDEPEETQRAVAQSMGASWRWRGGELESIAPRTLTRARRRGRDVCLCKLTSGSTGVPRVLPFTHAQMMADGRQVCATMRIGPGDVNLAIIPFGHSYGLGNLVLPLVLQGTAIVIGAGPLPYIIAAECARWRPTVFPAVPALLRVLTMADVPADALASVRLVISAGAALSANVAAAFTEKFQRLVHGFYGSSETGGICFDRTGHATAEGRSVGRPLKGVSLAFRRGGRFMVTSAAVMRGGSYAPPDRGELNAAGELVLRGRVGRMVKIAGRRLDLAEVETALRALPGVREAWACAHPRKADSVAAAVVTGQPARALRSALAERIAAWKVPDRLLVVAEFPLTARGKVDTRKLRALF